MDKKEEKKILQNFQIPCVKCAEDKQSNWKKI